MGLRGGLNDCTFVSNDVINKKENRTSVVDTSTKLNLSNIFSSDFSLNVKLLPDTLGLLSFEGSPNFLSFILVMAKNKVSISAQDFCA